MKKQNEAVKDRINSDIRYLFEQKKKKIIINQYEQVAFGAKVILSMRTMEIEIKNYHLKNILIKLDDI